MNSECYVPVLSRRYVLLSLISVSLLLACDGGREPTTDNVEHATIGGSIQALVATMSCQVTAWNGTEYRICDGLRTWTQARDYCSSLGTKLLKLDSKAENDFIQSKVRFAAWAGGSTPSIGGTTWSWQFDNTPFWKSGWIPSSGKPVNGAYTNWDVLEPVFGGTCLALDAFTNKWHAGACGVPLGFVCENPDACPNDPNKTHPGVCGCGRPDVDNDQDQVVDCTFLIGANDEPDVDECSLKVGSRPQSDMTSAAILFMDSVMPFADYLALAHDRREKTDAIFEQVGLACDILKGDVDGDLVPDSTDACPQTPPLTPTDDRGCTDSTRPDAPDSDKVRQIVNDMVIIWQSDPGTCDEAIVESPNVVAGYINNTQLGSAFVAAFFSFTVPGACPVRLRVEVASEDPRGWPVSPDNRVIYFEVPSSDFGPAFSRGAQVPGVASLILRDETFSDAYQNLWNAMGDNTGLDSSGNPAFSMHIRAMAVYGDGRQSAWSPAVPVRPWGSR